MGKILVLTIELMIVGSVLIGLGYSLYAYIRTDMTSRRLRRLNEIMDQLERDNIK